MDQFELAKQKHEKLKAKQAERTIPIQPIEVLPALLIPKEKPKNDHGVFECTVLLPDRAFKVVVVKRNIYANVTPTKISEANVKKALIEGLRNLVGEGA